MVEWLAGNRIRGTSAEKPVFGLPSGSVGGWKEVGRTTLGSNTSTIDVSNITDKRYYMILMDYTQTSDFSGLHRLGNSSIDTGNNYHNRQSSNGGTDSASQATYVRLDNGWQSGDRKFAVEYIADKTNREKLIMNHMVRSVTTGAGQAPQRSEVASKWVPSTASDIISKFQMMNGGTYASGSEVVVLGWDPDDTHTDNFWEELTTKQGTGAGSPLTTDTFTAKKYLWIQMYIDASGSPEFRVGTGGTISTSGYTLRTSSNGGTDETKINQVHLNAPTSKGYINMFIVNNSGNEKLFIYHLVDGASTGANNAPNRREYVGKWTTTSGQIDVVQLYGSGITFNADSVIKVWGSD